MAGIVCACEGLTKQWSRRKDTRIGPLSFSVTEGEIVGVRGNNGAGKSTLLEMMAGVLRPDGGTIRFAEGVRELTAYVPQELSLYESLSCSANLKFYGIAAGLPYRAIRTRRKWLLEQLSLSEKAHTKVSACSGGMKRRLHLATALMVTPKLLLLDEPTVGADAGSVEVIYRLLLHLKEMGCAILLITHADQDLLQLSDRVLTMENGQFV